VRPALRLVRAGNLGVSFVGTIVGGLVAEARGVALPSVLWAFLVLAGLSTALVTGGGNVLNDLLDREGDRTNHPDRPLVTGEVSVGAGKALAVGLFVGGVVVAVPVVVVQPLVGALLAVAVAALLAYELRGKARGLIGNVTVAFLTGLVFLYGGAAAGHAEILLPFAGMAFFATLSREIIKDMEDVAGDTARATLPQRYGVARAATAARISVAVALVLSAVPLLWFVALRSVPGIAYLAIVLAADAIFVASVVPLPRELHRAQSTSKVAMTVALFAFLAVAFR
jgi:geranylgeranylglycerol-phosphate geranylgeranyltransferase